MSTPALNRWVAWRLFLSACRKTDGSKPLGDGAWAQGHETFYSCNLQMFILS
jgi:hypothetical protein